MIARLLHGCMLTLLLTIIAQIPGGFVSKAEGATPRLSEALAEVRLFDGLSPDELTLLEEIAILRHGNSGERIVEQGKTLERMLIIMDGRAKVLVNGTEVAILAGQSLVGEIEFLDGQPASADVILLDKAELVEIDNGALNALMDRQPRLGYVIIRRIASIEAQRLRKSNRN